MLGLVGSRPRRKVGARRQTVHEGEVYHSGG